MKIKQCLAHIHLHQAWLEHLAINSHPHHNECLCCSCTTGKTFWHGESKLDSGLHWCRRMPHPMARRRMARSWGWRSFTFHHAEKKMSIGLRKGEYGGWDGSENMSEPSLHGGTWYGLGRWHRCPLHLDRPAQMNWETQWGVQRCRIQVTAYVLPHIDSCAYGDVSPHCPGTWTVARWPMMFCPRSRVLARLKLPSSKKIYLSRFTAASRTITL